MSAGQRDMSLSVTVASINGYILLKHQRVFNQQHANDVIVLTLHVLKGAI